MKVSDLVKFVKAGYTPGEIAKLEDPEKTLDLLNAGIKKEDVSEWLGLLDETKEQEEQQPDEQEEKDKQNSADPEKQDETDYKKLYTDLLKKQQEQNVNRDMSGNNKEKTNDEKLQDIVRKFM